MDDIICKTIFAYFLLLEACIIADLLFRVFPDPNGRAKEFHRKLDPVLNPVRFIIRHSSFYTPSFDLSPYVLLIILLFLQNLLLLHL